MRALAAVELQRDDDAAVNSVNQDGSAAAAAAADGIVSRAPLPSAAAAATFLVSGGHRTSVRMWAPFEDDFREKESDHASSTAAADDAEGRSSEEGAEAGRGRAYGGHTANDAVDISAATDVFTGGIADGVMGMGGAARGDDGENTEERGEVPGGGGGTHGVDRGQTDGGGGGGRWKCVAVHGDPAKTSISALVALPGGFVVGGTPSGDLRAWRATAGANRAGADAVAEEAGGQLTVVGFVKVSLWRDVIE